MKCYLYINKFIIFTNHSVLTDLFKLSRIPSKIDRWLSGCPDVLISDWGTNLISKTISAAYEKLGINHVTGTPFTFQSNAKTEGFILFSTFGTSSSGKFFE